MLLPSVERCIERVGTRKGHGFKDEDATRHMHEQFAGADVDQRHVLLDPPDNPDDVADVIVGGLEQGLLTAGTFLGLTSQTSTAGASDPPRSRSATRRGSGSAGTRLDVTGGSE